MKRAHGGRHGGKRQALDPLDVVQDANRAWWENSPMTYDWSPKTALLRGSPLWFENEDGRSLEEHFHFLAGRPAFESLLKVSELKGRDVLEVGVGSGLHAENLVRAGARVTGIDLSPTAVDISRQRFLQKNLDADLRVWDAEMDLPEFHDRFDVVWSWGVIHHSAHTARIVKNVQRWLRPGGVFAGMVYHRDSLRLPVALARDWLLHMNWSHSIDDALCRSTDGFSARFYPADQWRDLLLAFFQHAQTSVEGLDVDLVPLPRAVRSLVWRRLDPQISRRALQRTGHFLLFRAEKPID